MITNFPKQIRVGETKTLTVENPTEETLLAIVSSREILVNQKWAYVDPGKSHTFDLMGWIVGDAVIDLQWLFDTVRVGYYACKLEVTAAE